MKFKTKKSSCGSCQLTLKFSNGTVTSRDLKSLSQKNFSFNSDLFVVIVPGHRSMESPWYLAGRLHSVLNLNRNLSITFLNKLLSTDSQTFLIHELIFVFKTVSKTTVLTKMIFKPVKKKKLHKKSRFQKRLKNRIIFLKFNSISMSLQNNNKPRF